MAEVFPILSAISTASNLLFSFANQIKKYRQVSDRLFDLQENLDACEITLESWRRKYDVQERRSIVYMHVFFGRSGWEKIQRTLGSIKIISKTIDKEIDGVVAGATKFRPRGAPQGQYGSKYDEQLVRDCLRRISRNTAWTRKFNLSVLGKADDLQIELERLNRKLIILERLSDGYLEREHPDVFHDIRRLPGRRVILRVGDSRMAEIQKKLLEALSARKDAELLHRAGQGSQCHIGISVPQIHKRDFAFLLTNGDRTHEILIHPVKFRQVTDRNRLQPSISAAVPALIRDATLPCYMLPLNAPLSTGFQVSMPKVNLLSDLEFREPLSRAINEQQNLLSQQVIHPQDQVAIAAGLIQGCFRLLGSSWLSFLDSRNIRWRRSADGRWTTMMAASSGDGSTTRTLEQILNAGRARRDRRDLTKHTQMFRIGLLLVELALKTPVTYIEFDPQTSGAKVFIDQLGVDALDAHDIAAEVESRTNILYGNVVFFCLSVLQDREMMGNKEIESSYYKDVISQAEELESLVRVERRRGSPSPH
ncbi:hypothetical protein K432DRAFT_412816 [Lepidopterella palustris CBS 459.81]|uniref:Uncharacterized protein n=1 Tax=Lepidopterella palustris CBS 459.81 TaxID=1314670 RepID=A0A8E2JKM0_9PEZI|nr:hypothetical protein K432DRAFT_412816 [Lepidopterella palustris CBS 459.81]